MAGHFIEVQGRYLRPNTVQRIESVPPRDTGPEELRWSTGARVWFSGSDTPWTFHGITAEQMHERIEAGS